MYIKKIERVYSHNFIAILSLNINRNLYFFQRNTYLVHSGVILCSLLGYFLIINNMFATVLNKTE